MREPSAPRTVQCYHCRQLFDVPPRAMSISCPWCYKRVGLDDMTIVGTCWTSKLQTCGSITVRPKAVLIASLISASQGIEVHGTAEGVLISGGQIFIGAKARVRGEVRAPSIKVEKGGFIDGAFVQIAATKVDPARQDGGPARMGTGAVMKPLVRVPEWMRRVKTT